MPFDCAVLTRERQTELHSLADSLRKLGIKPVPSSVAHRHRAAEVKKRPADFFYTHSDMLPLTRVVFTIALGFNAIGAMLSGEALSGVSGFLATAAVAWWFRVFHRRVRGAAYWRSTALVVPPVDTPDTISALAYEVKNEHPDAVFVVDRLARESAVITDPILWVCADAERYCLGIWDGPKVIRVAKRV